MKDVRFWMYYLLLVVVQILLCNYADFSQYIIPVLLPAMILCISLKYPTVFCMVIAFVTGFAVDFFSGAPLGLTPVALVPVAACRKTIIRLVFGGELLLRNEELSVPRFGYFKMSFAVGLATLLYLVVFVFVDSAGTRSFGFNLARTLVSLAVVLPFGVYVAGLLTSERGEGRMGGK